jgi:hypothetical protein
MREIETPEAGSSRAGPRAGVPAETVIYSPYDPRALEITTNAENSVRFRTRLCYHDYAYQITRLRVHEPIRSRFCSLIVALIDHEEKMAVKSFGRKDERTTSVKIVTISCRKLISSS